MDFYIKIEYHSIVKERREIMKEQNRIKEEKKLLIISMTGVVFFIIVEGLMALVTSSQSILMDAVYGAADLLMILISIKIIPILYKPATEKNPFGFSQMESIFITIKGSMLTAVTVGLVLNNIQIMLKGGNHVAFANIAVFELIVGIICCGILALLMKLNKKLESSLVQAEIDAWTIDSVASIGLAIAFVLPAVIHAGWMEQFSPYLDQVVAIILSVFILPMPIKTAVSGLRDLFLIAPDEETVEFIKETGQNILNEYHLEQTVYDIIKTGRKIWVSIYFKSTDDMVSIAMIKEARARLEVEIKKEYPDLYVELIPEFEF
jgi:predicted Co/Zn/Cd cation transporter (cation efflux family)